MIGAAALALVVAGQHLLHAPLAQVVAQLAVLGEPVVVPLVDLAVLGADGALDKRHACWLLWLRHHET